MRGAPETQDRAALASLLAGDGVAVAARIIGLNGLAAEGAARAGDMETAFANLRAVAVALQEARDIVAIAEGRAGA